MKATNEEEARQDQDIQRTLEMMGEPVLKSYEKMQQQQQWQKRNSKNHR